MRALRVQLPTIAAAAAAVLAFPSLAAAQGAGAKIGEETAPLLSGVVLLPDGRPSADVSVWLVVGSYGEEGRFQLAQVRTDATGRFGFSSPRNRPRQRGIRVRRYSPAILKDALVGTSNLFGPTRQGFGSNCAT